MTLQNHNQAVANERTAVAVQDPVTSGATDRRSEAGSYTVGEEVNVRSRFYCDRISSGTVIGYGEFQTGLKGVQVEYQSGGVSLVNPALIV